MNRILGIDPGASAVKAVALEATFRTTSVRAFRSEPVPATVDGEAKPWEERVKVALQALAADGWFEADTVVCSLPAARVATHLLTLPFGDQRRVEQTLRFEVEDLIPFPLDEVVWDWHVVSRAANKTEVLVAVARSADIASLLALLKDAGVDPTVVTFSALSLSVLATSGWMAHQAPANPAAAPEPTLTRTGSAVQEAAAAPVIETEAVIDIGAERTDILLLEQGKAVFARSVAAGGAAVTRALARALEITPEAAEAQKLLLDLSGGADPVARNTAACAAAEQAVGALLREVRATLAGHTSRTRRRVDLVHLCGGGSQLQGLAELFSTALGVPARLLALKPPHAFPGDLAGGAQALALALRPPLGPKAPGLDFRKGPFASARGASAARGRVGALAAMAAVIVVLLGVSSWAKLSTLGKREEQLDAVLCETTKRILGTCEKDYRVALGKLKGKGSPAASVPAVSAVELSNLISNAFPPGDAAVLSDVDIADSTVRLRGNARDYETVDTVVGALEKTRCFGEIKKGKLVKGREDRIEFDVEGLYTCKSGSDARKSGSGT